MRNQGRLHGKGAAHEKTSEDGHGMCHAQQGHRLGHRRGTARTRVQRAVGHFDDGCGHGHVVAGNGHHIGRLGVQAAHNRAQFDQEFGTRVNDNVLERPALAGGLQFAVNFSDFHAIS
jgi:hypothetical protein